CWDSQIALAGGGRSPPLRGSGIVFNQSSWELEGWRNIFGRRRRVRPESQRLFLIDVVDREGPRRICSEACAVAGGEAPQRLFSVVLCETGREGSQHLFSKCCPIRYFSVCPECYVNKLLFVITSLEHCDSKERTP
ncbi:hypothetical protein AVEN_127668-1, partial [Araneus ventricosus]